MKKILVALLLLALSSTSHGQQNCLIGSATSNVQLTNLLGGTLYHNADGGAYVYFCDIGHHWNMNWYQWSKAEETIPGRLAIFQALLESPTQANLNNDIAALVVPATVDIHDPTSPLHSLAAMIDSTPSPTTIPPSGLAVQVAVIYKERLVPPNSYAWVAIGTITPAQMAAGVSCNPDIKLGNYYALVDRSVITLNAPADQLPSIAYADCTP